METGNGVEFHPKVVHINGVENNAIYTLSRLDLTFKANDLRVWVKNHNVWNMLTYR